MLSPRTQGNVFLHFCIVSSNELVVLENSKQYKNAGKRFRVYGAKDTLSVFDKFLAELNKLNLQNFCVNDLTKWFVFEAVQYTRSSCFIRYKTLGYPLVSLYLIKHYSCSFIKQYIKH